MSPDDVAGFQVFEVSDLGARDSEPVTVEGYENPMQLFARLDVPAARGAACPKLQTFHPRAAFCDPIAIEPVVVEPPVDDSGERLFFSPFDVPGMSAFEPPADYVPGIRIPLGRIRYSGGSILEEEAPQPPNLVVPWYVNRAGGLAWASAHARLPVPEFIPRVRPRARQSVCGGRRRPGARRQRASSRDGPSDLADSDGDPEPLAARAAA